MLCVHTVPIVACYTQMRRHNITLSEPISNKIKAEVKKGRFKDFSAAIQEAAWKHFGEPGIFEEYGVTAEEVDQSYTRTLKQIPREKKSGQLTPLRRT